ncbi:DUF6449 domain-containing protein [Mesobacillus harenae]|uniref:DUF6449 domain-containing protein n=1 Tax=Mesobacillus harenae TaxID=2213203 RepID=UPI0015807DF7|nr:DUF6449 domain-containing protein [Mesobacillus harenae]
MPSKISLFNKEIALQISRSIGWVSLVYFLGLAFILPIRMMMYYGEEYRFIHQENNLFRYDFPIQMIFMIIVPVLLAVFLLRFLQVKLSVDLMHSLPLKRESLFFQYTLTGLFFLLLPIVAVALLVAVLHGVMDLDTYFGLKDIYGWAGYTIMFNIIIYSAGIFVGMLTGISAVQGVLTYILLLFPAGITLLIFVNMGTLFYGFPSDYFLNRELEKMSPLTTIYILEHNSFSWTTIGTYLAITLVLYLLSLWIYKKRKTEAVTQAIAFPKLKSIFKYGVTFCVMLLGGMYFGEVQNHYGWTVFGYAVGTIIGYFAAEMVLEKTWRVFGHIKGLIIYGAVFTVLAVSVPFLTGYENRVPDQEDVKGVILTNNHSVFIHNYEDIFKPSPLTDEQSIQQVRELHKQIVANKRSNNGISPSSETALFIYELKDGNKVIREYVVPRDLYTQHYKPIYESEKYKRAVNEIFKVKPHQAEKVTIQSHGMVPKHITITDSAEVEELVAAVQKDILEESYESMVYRQGNSASMEIYMGGNSFVYLELKPSYNNLKEWLERKDLLHRAMVIADDISYILVGKESDIGLDPYSIDSRQVHEKLENHPNTIKITDKARIQECLDRATWNIEETYIASFMYETEESPELKAFHRDHAPEFIKKHFEE